MRHERHSYKRSIAPSEPASEWNPSAYVSVNVAALDDLDPRELMAAPIQYCDGRNDNWWEKPDFVAHL